MSSQQSGVEALLREASARLQKGDHAAAMEQARHCLTLAPKHAGAMQLMAVAAGAGGDNKRAVSLLRQALRQQPGAPTLLINLATALGRLGRHDRAVAACREAVANAPGQARPLTFLAGALRDAGELPEAREAIEQAVALAPADTGAQLWLAQIAEAQGDTAAAAAALDRCVKLAPERADPLRRRAALAVRTGDHARALADASAAVQRDARDPRNHETHLEVARASAQPGALRDALAAARRALPRGHTSLEFHEAALLEGDGRYSPAAQGYQKVLATDPDHLDALLALLRIQLRFADYEAAEATLKRALQVHPEPGSLALTRAGIEKRLGRAESAADLLERRLAEDPPETAQLYHLLADIGLEACLWDRLEWALPGACEALRTRPEAPLGCDRHAVVFFPLTAAEQYRVFTAVAGSIARNAPATSRAAPSADGGARRLRIGYVSGDIREHPSMHLAGHVFGRHDRSRFSVYVYSIGPPGENPWRERIAGECDGFRDLWRCGHAEAVQAIRDDGIDILVDCMGYTVYSRPELIAARPAPVQVGWLAFPGTTGGGWLDYFVADRHVAPDDVAAGFSERLVHMPGCYLPTDDGQTASAAVASRAAEGLPEDAVVYCCFNSTRKLTPALFRCWMRVLENVPGSVLWLLAPEGAVRERLQSEARRAGIAPERLVFAGREKKPEHLARLRLADLFLDTESCNAHTTAVDALWVGVPMLTCPGPSFASRVGTSVLHAAGLPELVMDSWDGYEAEAIALGRNPARLRGLREKLEAGRGSSPLFDSDGYVRALERAYEAAWDRYRQGLPPESFDVA